MTTQTTIVVTSEVPVVNGDILRATGSPALTLPSPDGLSPKSETIRRPSIAEAVGIDLDAIGKVEARKIMSEEHRVLGFRPPHGSLAAEVQAAAAKHPEGKPGKPLPDPVTLKELARQDAQRILIERKVTDATTSPGMKVHVNGNGKAVKPPATGGVNLGALSAAEARTLMSHEHKALGFRPPPGSLAAEAQAAAAKNPEGAGVPVVDPEVLKEIALKDAERIKADREINVVGDINVSTPELLAGEAKRAPEVHSDAAIVEINHGGEQTDSMSGLIGDLALSDVRRHSDLVAPDPFSKYDNCACAILRSGGMRRTETGDFITIAGDVIG